MIENESGDRQSQTRMLFSWKSVEILVVNFSSTLFLSPLLARKENQKLPNFNKAPLLEIQAPIHNLKAAGLKLIDCHLRSVGVEWVRSSSWDAELKYFHVPFKKTSPDHLVISILMFSQSR